VNTPATRQRDDENAPTRELLLRRHVMLRVRLQSLLRQTGANAIESDGIALSGTEAAQAVAEEVRRQIVETDLALARIGNGTYGICERCGQRIPARRMEVLPTAIRCVGCAGSSRARAPGYRSRVINYSDRGEFV
jgi:DnaK suppressor protein